MSGSSQLAFRFIPEVLDGGEVMGSVQASQLLPNSISFTELLCRWGFGHVEIQNSKTSATKFDTG